MVYPHTLAHRRETSAPPATSVPRRTVRVHDGTCAEPQAVRPPCSKEPSCIVGGRERTRRCRDGRSGTGTPYDALSAGADGADACEALGGVAGGVSAGAAADGASGAAADGVGFAARVDRDRVAFGRASPVAAPALPAALVVRRGRFGPAASSEAESRPPARGAAARGRRCAGDAVATGGGGGAGAAAGRCAATARSWRTSSTRSSTVSTNSWPAVTIRSRTVSNARMIVLTVPVAHSSAIVQTPTPVAPATLTTWLILPL